MFFRIYFSLAGYKLVVFHPGRGGAGKGKRRFAPQGVWRSGGVGADVDPVVWLPRPGPAHRVPLPPPQHGPQPKKPRQKDEFYLAEVQRDCLRENPFYSLSPPLPACTRVLGAQHRPRPEEGQCCSDRGYLPDLEENQVSANYLSLWKASVAAAVSSSLAYRPIMGLEYSQYLENYLWPNFDPDKVHGCVSVACTVNLTYPSHRLAPPT